MGAGELLRGWSVALGRHVGVAVAGLVWLVVLTRSLEPSAVGLVVLAGALPAAIVPLVNLGVPMGLAYLTASRSDQHEALGLWGRSAAIRLASAAAGLAALASLVVSLLAPGVDGALLVGLAAVPPALAATVAAGWFQGARRFGTQAGILVAPHVLTLAGTLVAVGLDRTDPLELVLVIVAAHVATAACALRLLPAGRAGAGQAIHREIWSHAWRMWLSEAGAAVRGRLDLLVVAAVLGTTDAAVFATATAVAAQLALVSLGANQVVFPLVASRRGADRAELTAAASRLTFVATLVAAGLAGVMAGPLLELLYGADFRDGVPTLIAYLPAVVLLSVSRIVTADLYGRGRADLVLRLSMQATAVGVPLLIVGVGLWGAEGAAAAASVGAAHNTAIRVHAWRRLASRRQSLIAFGRHDVAALRAALRAPAT